MNDKNKIYYLVLFLLALAVNFSGINLGLFSDDQGLYASIAKNLLYKKDFFQLFTYNQDWLDKPHFPFWMILLSFKIFGVSAWAYRLPALLFFCLSLVYTYIFTRRYYHLEVAAMAVLILMTAQHVLLSNSDVRAEPYLMALITGGIYHISRLEQRFSVKHLLLAALLTACAIMTKGIFVIIATYGSLLGQLIFTKNLKSLFKLRWLFLLLITALFTLPELYALYTQFDIHPQKVVFGHTHVSGIKWFLWDSQFGRFVNNGPISRKVSGSLFFYLHTLLWAFAPWCLLFYFAVYKNIKAIYLRKTLAEYYALSGGILLLLLFSLSRFQLPFYTNAVFPLFAVITAPVCFNQLSSSETKFRLVAEWSFVVLLPVTIVLANFLVKSVYDSFFGIDCLLLGVCIMLVPINITGISRKAFFFCCVASLFAGFYLNTIFYKVIIHHKGELAASEYINQKPFKNVRIYTLKAGNNIFQFYCNKTVDIVPIEQFSTIKLSVPSVFYVNEQSMEYLRQTHAGFTILRSFVDYPSENILPAFINKATRYKVLSHSYLIIKSL